VQASAMLRQKKGAKEDEPWPDIGILSYNGTMRVAALHALVWFVSVGLAVVVCANAFSKTGLTQEMQYITLFYAIIVTLCPISAVVAASVIKKKDTYEPVFHGLFIGLGFAAAALSGSVLYVSMAIDAMNFWLALGSLVFCGLGNGMFATFYPRFLDPTLNPRPPPMAPKLAADPAAVSLTAA